MEDNEIITLFFSRDQRAIEESDLKYGPRLLRLSGRILNSMEDAEEIRNDTYMKAWQSIPPEKPANLAAYLLTICRNLSLNRLRSGRAAKRNAVIVELTKEMEECIPGSAEPSGLSGEETGKLLSRFLAELPELDRFLFVRRYFEMCTVRELAKQCKKTENLVRVRLHRIRSRLKIFLEKEGMKL
ncbi:MAG: RNA polymerase sigma factor [Parasporobacterium sp.]|nr:RNA polymerase sigma factor [Parasporobacterium sp.]